MTRLALPHRRSQDTFDLVSDGHRYSASVGYHNDGAPGEIFLQVHKVSSQLEAVARDAAILMSLAMQHGVPVEQMRDAVTRDGQGRAATIVGAVLDAMGEGR